MVSWVPVIIDLALAVVPRDGDALLIDPKTMRTRQGFDIISSLYETVLSRFGEDRRFVS